MAMRPKSAATNCICLDELGSEQISLPCQQTVTGQTHKTLGQRQVTPVVDLVLFWYKRGPTFQACHPLIMAAIQRFGIWCHEAPEFRAHWPNQILNLTTHWLANRGCLACL